MKPLRPLALILALLSIVQTAPADTSTPIPTPAPGTPQPIFINLSALADWGTQQPFIDRMKVARAWVGHLPGRWGGVEAHQLEALGVLDDNGWPTHIPGELSSIGTLIMTDLPEEATDLAGRYVLRFEGDGIVEASGRAENVRYGPNELSFDFTPGPGGVELKIQRSDRRGTGDYLRNITVVRADRLDAFDQGAVFNPDFLAVIKGFQGLRFMDWMQTNGSTQADWAERPQTDDYTFTRRGIPIEVMIDLANTVAADPWLTLPHQGDDMYFRKAAEMVKARIDPSLQVYVEYSNEVWNWQFPQATWAEEQGQARWGGDSRWMQFYGMRAAQMALIWRDVFADRTDALVTVFSTQAEWLGLEDQALNAPLWRAEDPANPSPHQTFDAYAITGYASALLGHEGKRAMVQTWLEDSQSRTETDARAQGLTGSAFDAHIAAHRFDHAITLAQEELFDGRHSGDEANSVRDLMTRVLPYHRDVAAMYGLQLVMYEGGTHVVGHGALVDDPALDPFFRAFNYSDEMAVIYAHLLAGWAQITDGPFNIYNDVSRVTKWGSWGALRYLSDANPRWDMILQFRDGAR